MYIFFIFAAYIEISDRLLKIDLTKDCKDAISVFKKISSNIAFACFVFNYLCKLYLGFSPKGFVQINQWLV